MEDFTYSRPASLSDAVAVHGNADDAMYMAGGQTLIPVLKQGLAMPTDVIDLGAVWQLDGIAVSGGTVTIGAMTRHAVVAASNDVGRAIPALATLAGGIGDAQVRNRGTIGGSLANNDPSADYPAAVLGLNATVVTDRRELAAGGYFDGMFATSLEPGEIITAVKFPVPEKAGYAKFPNPASRYALVGVFVAKTASGVRVAATGAGQDGVFRVTVLEDALNDDFRAAPLRDVTIPEDNLMTDMHADAAYRAHLIGVMTARAVARANGRD
ncbi:MAG: carbon monoxide dehydrogenase [Rhodospirillales bacterium CG15_BIG_FIL_POST_REV_8_21_14_020_66_15]|nr:MAG: carbon monoxide dehydrogenase [Rhodospirillales bacterium CG15_BIG_FIL_POST_REV_8_21_14_020_66_15]